MSENSVFADAFHFYMYNGEQVVNPDSLKAVDTKETALPFKDDDTDAVQKYRDVFKPNMNELLNILYMKDS
ncbi:MAG: hypothetical protein ACI32N_02625 [Bulleidia sp.]